MKKFMMAAVALICMTMTSVALVSCGDDDNDSTTPAQKTPNTYEVTVTAILHQCTSEFFNLDVEYTDADGKKNTVTVKAGDQSEEMSEEAKKVYQESMGFVADLLEKCTQEEKADFDKYIVKNFKITVPEGKSCSFAGTIKARKDFTISSEYVNIITPMVFATCKYVSGDNPNKGISGAKGNTKASAYFGVETAHIDEAIENLDGRSAGKATINL
jgi:hypothetical protein